MYSFCIVDRLKQAKALTVTLIELFDLPELKERPDNLKKKLAQEMKHFDDETATALLND